MREMSAIARDAAHGEPARAAILGASGYTGAELIRLVADHPRLVVTAMSADRKAGQEMAAVFPHLRHLDLPALRRIDEIDFGGVDICFAALPHATSQAVIADLPAGLRVIDLSADFRLRDPAGFERWYGVPHAAPELQSDFVYGLTEFYREAISGADRVACTGCNAAAVLYALWPLVAAEVVDLDDIVVDLLAAVSGAGRSPKEHLLHAELSEGAAAYATGGTHRHLGEFDQELSRLAGRPVEIVFQPHLIPANRGVLATCHVRGGAEAIHAALNAAYRDEPFIHVLPIGEAPSMRHVRGSNYCHLGVVGDRRAGRATIFATLDNLTKGSAGQALQNANLILGYGESTGLTAAPIFP